MIGRWNPSDERMTLRDAMSQLFDESFVGTGAHGGQRTRAAATPIDVYGDDDQFVIEVALPGLAPESVNVTALGNQVAISGEYPIPPENRSYLLRERPVGRFERTITLPDLVNADKARAHYEHGVLELVLPKAESARPKRIALKTGK